MEAPDVIYLAESDKVKGEVSSNFASENPFKMHTSIAYIRKDTLLEWAKEQLDILNKQTLLHPDDEVFWGQRNAFKQLIDKLNKM